MSLYIDKMYINIIGSRLDKFKKVSNDVFNCRCPLCGDSKKKSTLARGYFYKKKDRMKYKCHNCGNIMSFYTFLEEFDSTLFKEYKMEIFRGYRTTSETKTDQEPVYKNEKLKFDIEKDSDPDETSETSETLLDSLLDRLDTLNDDHPCVKYCLERKIPREQLKRLYYIDDMSLIGGIHEKYSKSLREGESRLVIPLHNSMGEFSGISCRALDDSDLRYIVLKIKEDSEYYFGVNELDLNKTIYVVEGQIDSLFVPNSIAVGGTGFKKVKSGIMVVDNQPRNKEICKLISSLIDMGRDVVIWPESITEKDINEMVKVDIDVMSVINKNIFRGLEAKMRFTKWRKV